MKNITQKILLFFLFGIALSFFVSHKSYAYSGPVGLNQLIAESGPNVGQVTLHWARYNRDVSNYTIQYGRSSGKYPYAVDVGNNVVYTIGSLQPGARYYFFIQGYNGTNMLPAVTPEISEVAASAPQTIMSTAGPFGQRQLTAISGPTKGQITISWISILPDTNNFSVVYGTQPGIYQYGAVNIAPVVTVGSQQTYTIGFLAPGQRYYIAVVPMQNGTPIYSSGEVSQIAHR